MKFSNFVQAVVDSVRKKAPSEAPSPKSGDQQGPIEGGGGSTTPPSAPFDPNQVTFRTQTGGGSPATELKVEGVALAEDPDAGGEVAGLRDLPGLKVESIALTEDPDAGGEEIPVRLRDTTELKVEEPAVSEDPDAGGEETPVRLRDTTELKVEEPPVTEDPDAGGEEIPVRLRDTTGLKVEEPAVAHVETPEDHLSRRDGVLTSSDPEEGGEVAGGDFNIKIEEVVPPPASPPGVPVPYPNVADASDGNTSLADALARKAGEGQKDYLVVKMDDVLVSSRETTADRRTEVKDSHDRHANVEANGEDLEDDPESSTLLSLEASPGMRLVRPGLAGASNTDLDMDLVDDPDDDLDDDPDDVAP